MLGVSKVRGNGKACSVEERPDVGTFQELLQLREEHAIKEAERGRAEARCQQARTLVLMRK